MAELARMVREVAAAVRDPADPASAAADVLRSAAEALSATGAALFLLDSDTGLLIPAAAYGPQSAFVKDIAPVDPEHEHNEMAQVFTTGDPVYVADFYPDAGAAEEGAEGVSRWRSAIATGSHAVLPLRVGREAVGALTLQWPDAQDFSPDQTTLIASVAGAVAAVVKRAERAQEPSAAHEAAPQAAFEPAPEPEPAASPEPPAAFEPPAAPPRLPADEMPPFLRQPRIMPRDEEASQPRVIPRNGSGAGPLVRRGMPQEATAQAAPAEPAAAQESAPAAAESPLVVPGPAVPSGPRVVFDRRHRPRPEHEVLVADADLVLRGPSEVEVSAWVASASALRVAAPQREGTVPCVAFWEAFRLPGRAFGLVMGTAESSRTVAADIGALVAGVVRAEAEGGELAKAARKAESAVASVHGDVRLSLLAAAVDLDERLLTYRISGPLRAFVACCGGRVKALPCQDDGPANNDFLMPGDTLLAITPSLLAARRGGVAGDEFGAERVAATLAAVQPLPAVRLPGALYEEVADWVDWWPPADVLLLGFTHHAR